MMLPQKTYPCSVCHKKKSYKLPSKCYDCHRHYHEEISKHVVMIDSDEKETDKNFYF